MTFTDKDDYSCIQKRVVFEEKANKKFMRFRIADDAPNYTSANNSLGIRREGKEALRLRMVDFSNCRPDPVVKKDEFWVYITDETDSKCIYTFINNQAKLMETMEFASLLKFFTKINECMLILQALSRLRSKFEFMSSSMVDTLFGRERCVQTYTCNEFLTTKINAPTTYGRATFCHIH